MVKDCDPKKSLKFKHGLICQPRLSLSYRVWGEAPSYRYRTFSFFTPKNWKVFAFYDGDVFLHDMFAYRVWTTRYPFVGAEGAEGGLYFKMFFRQRTRKNCRSTLRMYINYWKRFFCSWRCIEGDTNTLHDVPRPAKTSPFKDASPDNHIIGTGVFNKHANLHV